MSYSRITVFFIALLFLCSCTFRDYTLLEKAEELTRQKKYDEAINTYQRHIDYRLQIKDRPEWENPYFYLLAIGDLLVAEEKPDEALKTYEKAEEAGVEASFVSDRFRYVAAWYEKRNDLEKALAVLTTYRDRDPLLFDSIRDRIARDIVKREDEGREVHKSS